MIKFIRRLLGLCDHRHVGLVKWEYCASDGANHTRYVQQCFKCGKCQHYDV